MTVLDASTKVRLNPLELRKAGAIIENMQSAGYDSTKINFCQTEEDLRAAWNIFDTIESGTIDSCVFEKVLPLMGESISPAEMTALFAKADKDGSGLLEFPEFCQLVKAMNPKEDTSGSDMFGFSKSEGSDQQNGSNSIFGALSSGFNLGAEKIPEEPKTFGKRGTKVREWRSVRARKYEEILTSGEVPPGMQHEVVEQILRDKAAMMDAKIAEIRKLQGNKEDSIANHKEITEMCQGLVYELLDFKDIDEILPRAKRKHAKKCFLCFDADASGELDVEEFTVLMKLIDPSMNEEGVDKMFEDAGVVDGLMEFREFCVWCAVTFGRDGDNELFATDMNELILKVDQNGAAEGGQSSSRTPRAQDRPKNMSDTKVDWATRLFNAFDEDDSGSLELDEFFELMQSIDPDIERSSLAAQFEELGIHDGMMNLSQFLEWANRMFGEATSDEDFMTDMRELIAIGKEHFMVQNTPREESEDHDED